MPDNKTPAVQENKQLKGYMVNCKSSFCRVRSRDERAASPYVHLLFHYLRLIYLCRSLFGL
ncbi:hypothetical protein HMPREF0080_02009 [Anaeroglobus geminatus F0357]|uniref:Uncharacterized protein n=1 Tax=Anaeroglobus geminatus F0357 TaxID=861450 RepID=G9YK03_9FIRM|nr:hypothetical protein HMPREF0080_02009 [Anaeroglobus geminatus F0357]